MEPIKGSMKIQTYQISLNKQADSHHVSLIYKFQKIHF